jgi:hypothetical protein
VLLRCVVLLVLLLLSFCVCCAETQRFFHGTHVIRSEFGVDSLAVSGRLFGSVTSALLSSNFLIELWSQNAAGDWEVTARASPGDPRAIEQILQEYNLSMPDLTQQAVMGALYATGGASAHDIQIGLAYMDVNSSKAFVTQIREGPDLSGLSAVIAASGVRECLLPSGVQTDSGSAFSTIASLLESCGVKVTQVKRTMFQSPSMEVEQELERLLLVPDGSAQQRQQAVQSLLEMPLATTACVALVSPSCGFDWRRRGGMAGMNSAVWVAAQLRHLDLFENPTAAGTLSMQQGEGVARSIVCVGVASSHLRFAFWFPPRCAGGHAQLRQQRGKSVVVASVSIAQAAAAWGSNDHDD